MDKFNLRKLSELDVIKQYQIKISNRFVTLENLNDNEDINWDWENTIENIKTSTKESRRLYKLKQHKQRFDNERSGFLIKGSRLKYSGYRIQTKAMQII